MEKNVRIDILKYALVHLEIERSAVQEKIDRIKSDLGKGPGGSGGGRPMPVIAALVPAPRRRRMLSASARKRIGAAQKRRWAEYHKTKKVVTAG